jgi:uncharacterized metal-binding protein
MLLNNGKQMQSLPIGSLPVVISYMSTQDADPSNSNSFTLTSLVCTFLLSPHLDWTYTVTNCISNS